MPLPPFQKGALVAGAAIFGFLSVLAVAAFAVLVSTANEDPPDPTASQVEVDGVLGSRDAGRVCVDPRDDGSGPICGIDVDGVVTDDLAVGDRVVGTLVAVETDPGSGARWHLWSDLGRPPA